MKILLLDIAWLAGLLEGEGSFHISTKRGKPSSLLVVVQMTDGDIIERVAQLFNRPMHGPYKRRNPSYKPFYSTSISASSAASWMMTLYPFLGQRRREKIKELLHFWRAQAAGRGGRPRASYC